MKHLICVTVALAIAGAAVVPWPLYAQDVATAGSREAPGQDQPDDELVPPTSANDFTAAQLDAVLAGAWRSEANRARDMYRHPKKTLQFFGVRPDQTIVEVTPSAGWYAEILAPLLHDNGTYIAAVQAPPLGRSGGDPLQRKFAADPARYGHARIVSYDPRAPVLGEPGSADMVLTFRNVHNWVLVGTAPAMFKAFYAVLAPGGVLGVVDHRAAPGATLDAVRSTGYLPTDYVVKLATDAGFRLDASSDINANPKDDHDHPKGVWTLPPTLALGDKDKAHYQAIGESDRMTLRFVKPLGSAMVPVPSEATSAP